MGSMWSVRRVVRNVWDSFAGRRRPYGASSSIGGAVLLLATALIVPGLAAAAGLSNADFQYLKAEFGLGKDSFTLTNASASDAAKLHDLINDPFAKDYPKTRDFNVADYLFDVEMRTCQAWQLAHAARSCPQVADQRLMPGWQIAERSCIACHLTGTVDAPSFFKLVQPGPIDENRLAAALGSGHRMSPITLGPQELQDLARYMNSLR
jgi:hypothetical protein